jgi:Flp pilus assembly pilin Flp
MVPAQGGLKPQGDRAQAGPAPKLELGTSPPNLKLNRDRMTHIRNFFSDEQGQDLIEYTLLLAFVALASAALFIGAGNSVKGIWSITNSQLDAANTSAS